MENYLTSNLQEYFSYQEKLEYEGMEECKNARKKHGLIPNPEEDHDDTGFCEECPVYLSGKCTIVRADEMIEL